MPKANDGLLEGLMGGANGLELHGPVLSLPDVLKDVLLEAIDLQIVAARSPHCSGFSRRRTVSAFPRHN